jgi:YVTN family beta-propeller protein
VHPSQHDPTGRPQPAQVHPVATRSPLWTIVSATLPLALLAAGGCRRLHFPDVPAGYREFAYVSNSGSNTVSVLDLVYLRQDRTLAAGIHPTGMAVNPVRDEVYAVNTGTAAGNGSVSVIDTKVNRVVATIPVHKLPYFIDVDPAGRRAYVANSGSNTVSILDLDLRRETGVIGVGEQPRIARISPDMRSLVVTNQAGGSVSLFAVEPPPAAGPLGLAVPPKKAVKEPLPALRAVFSGCPGARDAVIAPTAPLKVFVACSSASKVMVVSLAAAPGSWEAKQNPSLLQDHLLTFLDVGMEPTHLALKPDGGEIFCSNYGSDSVSEIETGANEVGGTYTIANRPVSSIVAADDSTLWVTNFGADSINLWSIDDGHLAGSVRTGRAPDALAFSADQHLLLAADSESGDVAVIRTVDKNGPALFTILPAGASPNAIVVKAMPGRP